MYEALCPDFTFTSSRLQKSLKDKLSAFAELSGGMKAVLKPKKQNFRIAFVSSHFYHHSIGRILIELMYHMRADAASLGYGHFELFAFFMDNHAMSNEDELTKAYQTLLKGAAYIICYRNDLVAMFSFSEIFWWKLSDRKFCCNSICGYR